jgi:hypothetical protein
MSRQSEHQAIPRPPDEDDGDGRCHTLCCSFEVPCGKMSYWVRVCAWVSLVASLAGVVGGIYAANVMSGEVDPNKCKVDWAPTCLAAKVLIVVSCAVAVGVSVIGLYCCCQNCNGDYEQNHRKGLVECFRCHSLLFVPPVALHFHCAKCYAPLSLTHEKPHELPDPEPPAVPAKANTGGFRVSEPDVSREVIKQFILKADLNHDGALSKEEIEEYLQKTAGTPEQAQAVQAIQALTQQAMNNAMNNSADNKEKASSGGTVAIDVQPKSS